MLNPDRPRRWVMKVLVAATIFLLVCTPVVATPDILSFNSPSNAEAMNSATYAVRAPLSGHLNYYQAITYINDGMQYVDPNSSFVVSPAGALCFFMRPISPETIYDSHYSNWCVYPQSIGSVDAVIAGGDNVGEIRLWCRHSSPHCAFRLDYPNPLSTRNSAANQLTVRVIPRQLERAALEDLIFVMGGRTAPPGAAGNF
jgi:hypothetical protein